MLLRIMKQNSAENERVKRGREAHTERETETEKNCHENILNVNSKHNDNHDLN